MSGPHDLLSRYTFALPEEAIAELRLALPPEVASLLDWSTLHVESSIVIDPELRETEKDIVYSARLLTGEPAVLILFEHLSTTDRWVPLRLLNYVVRYLLRWRELHPDSQFLPAIFPVVLYTGSDQDWNAPLGEALERLRSHTVRMSYLKLLAVRGIRVSSRARQRILACQDLATLEQWFTRAVHATTVSEVFDELPQ